MTELIKCLNVMVITYLSIRAAIYVYFECECDQDGDWCNVYGKSFTHWMAAIGLPATPEADE